MYKKYMFFIDFDGTISKEDMCAAMVKTFAREGWEELNNLWEKGVLSTEECAQRTLELIDAKPEELNAFFDKSDIDETFPAFIKWAEQNKYPISILSDGYDNYIDVALKKSGFTIPYYANHLEYEKGWRIKCPHLDKECKQCGVCKTGLVKLLLKPECVSVYIGDGYSDICPAEYCDIVFAKKQLAVLCKEKSISYNLYHDFNDVQKIIEGLL